MRLEASHPFAFLDYVRAPYTVVGEDALGRPVGSGELGCLVERDTGRCLWWVLADRDVGAYRLGSMPVFGHVAPDTVSRRWLDVIGAGWDPVESVTDDGGRVTAHVWRDAAGDWFLPFDPAETMLRCWSERYRHLSGSSVGRWAKRLFLKAYYLVRPVIPRRVQIKMRQAFTSVQRRSTFPGWPVEDGLHDLYDWLFTLISDVAGAPMPWIDLWPDGRSWAIVLTHDVDSQAGFDDIELLRGIERAAGRTSSWNIVPERYVIDPTVLDRLRQEGCEIGVHGLRHDGRDLGSRRAFEARLPTIRRYADRWGAVGFRAPATQRVWEWMPRLGFDYDSSYPDTDPFEPSAGGACTFYPFTNQDMVELPITLPQDHTLFAILRLADGSVWLDKTRHIRDRGGMALLITHPDGARDHRVTNGYGAVIDAFANDDTAWWALPRDVSAWWQDRAASEIVATEDGWKIRGAAAGRARVRFGGHDGVRAGHPSQDLL